MNKIQVLKTSRLENKSGGGYRRNSSIELLKVIAIFLIVLSHCSPAVGLNEEWPSYIQTSLASTSVQRIIIVFFTYGGQIGNAIFIISSAWFLIEQPKNSYKKILGIIFDVWMISALFLLIHLITGESLSLNDVVHYLFPITFNNNWFAGCYIIFYTIHPLLNQIIASGTRQQLFKLVFISLFVYSGAQVLMPWRYYYNDLVGFIVLYFVTAYVKKYIRPFLVRSYLKTIGISFVTLILLIIITNIMGLKFPVFSNQLTRWNTYINPIIIVLAISLVRLFSNVDFSNRFVNHISSASLIVYLLHYNLYTSRYIIPVWFRYVFEEFSYRYLVIAALVLAGLLFVSTELLAQLYKKIILNLKEKIIGWEWEIMTGIYNIAYQKFDSFFHY